MIDLKQKAAHKEYAIAGGAFSPSVFARFTVGSNYYNTAFSARQLRDNIGKYVGVGISFPLLSGLQRLTNQRKLKLNMYRLKNEEELEKQQYIRILSKHSFLFTPDIVNISRHYHNLTLKHWY